MKSRLSLIFAALLLMLPFVAKAADVDRMEPPFWYTGMKNPTVQVMFHGKDIAKADFQLKKYSGVKVREVCRTDNPNYLFVYLDIDRKAKPGKLEFSFRDAAGVTTRQMELRGRNTAQGAMGFTQQDVLYLIMPDRFANGDPSNDEMDGYKVDRRGGGRHGGDLKGIVDHLDYINDLGVTAIWLNPVQFNKGGASHGYAISDYYLVDPRFGSNEEYCDMISAAHDKGIKVVMDMIFNHSGISHWWIADMPASDWFNQADMAAEMGRMMAQGGQRRGFGGPRMGSGSLVNTTHYKWVLLDPHAPQSEKDILVDGWFVAGMPDLNQRNRHLATYLIQNSIWWIEYSRIDGIRMDTYPYADYDFMTRWCREVREEYPDFNIVGEGWYPRNSAAGWWQSGSRFNDRDTGLKTVMDFDLTFTTQEQILKESNTKEGSEAGLFKMYECLTQDFLIPDPNFVLTFLDNHDIARFFKPGDPLWKFKQGIAFLLASRGIPQIYYGTEILMTGMRDDFPGGWQEDQVDAFTPQGRTPEQNEAFDFARKLLNFRKSSKALTEGSFVHYTPDNNSKCYVFGKTTGDNTVMVILNGSDRAQSLPMARFADLIGGSNMGTDVITGREIDLRQNVSMEPRGVYVLELSHRDNMPYATAAPYARFSEGLIDNIQAEGWLKEILVRQREGLTGHPEAMAYPYNSCLWAGELERDSESRGADWWRFEQTAYYLDGLTRLGYLLDDRKLLSVWKENIEYVLAHPLPAKKGMTREEAEEAFRPRGRRGGNFAAQVSEDPRLQQRMKQWEEKRQKQIRIAMTDRPEGRLGPETGSMAWPFAVFFRAVKAYYEATGDPRIPAALEKNYLSYSVEELGMDRFVVNVEGILWTYAITGNPALRELAIAAWDQNGSELTQANCLDDSEYHMHGVTMDELLKIPLLLYAYTGEQKYLDAALKADAKMERANMMIDGINSSSEALAGIDALASHETCDISDYTWTAGYYLMATGDAQWADKIEKGIFNAGLGAITKDFKSMQYFSCPNQFIATGNSNHNGFKHGLTWMAYRPIHETECCIGNLHRYMPNYVARMWLRDNNGNPVAALYGPSSVEYYLGRGISVKIKENTAYPFEEQIRFEFNFYKDGFLYDGPVQMDFTYRIPQWCKAAASGFVTESRQWKSGDVFTVDLPMEIEVVSEPYEGTSIQRGPLLYTYAIPSAWEEDTQIYGNLAGKVSANPDFKSWSITPVGKWNYALVGGMLDNLKYESSELMGFPFDPESVNCTITVPVVGVKGWELLENRYTPALPKEVQAESEEVSYIKLVPYGSTTLRLTTFPVYNR